MRYDITEDWKSEDIAAKKMRREFIGWLGVGALIFAVGMMAGAILLDATAGNYHEIEVTQ